MVDPTQPVNLTERAEVLDALRGMAILGIFLDNILAFSGYVFLSQESQSHFSTFHLDRVFSFLEIFLVHGKFYTIFSILFGIGFSIILDRNYSRGTNPLPIFYRRLGLLSLIGWIHLRWIWEGDILLLYAVLGSLLPLFNKVSNRNLLIWAAGLIFSPIILDGFKVLFGFQPGGYFLEKAIAIDFEMGIPLDDSYALYLYEEGAGWAEWKNWTASGWVYRIQYLLESNRIPKVLGCFLIGLWIGRNKLFRNLEEHKLLLKEVQKWGFIFGIPFCLATAFFFFDKHDIPEPLAIFETITYALGVVPLGLAYVATLALNWKNLKEKTLVRPFLAVGRLALSNYLFQSAIGIVVFYGIGLGLGGKFGPTLIFPIALLIFLFQSLLSKIWLLYFRFGPLEWLWRMGTYLKIFPIKK
jgi:uncharacterized protein